MRTLGPSIAELERQAQQSRERAARRRADEDLERLGRRHEAAAALLVGLLLGAILLVALGGPA